VRDPKAPPSEVSETNIRTIPRAAERVGQIEVEAPTGAQIEIDSKDKVGHAPLLDPYAVLAGSHQVVVVVGAQRLSKDVSVAAGQTVHVALGAAPPLVPLPPSAIPVVDPAPVSRAPAPLASPPAEPSTDAGATRDEGGPSDTRKWVTVGFGAGAVLLAAGSLMMFSLSNSSKETASELQLELPPGSCPNGGGCASLSSDLHNQNSYFHVGEGLAVGAGAAVVGALVSWFAISPTRSRSALVVLPSVASSRPAVVVEGSF
jgi:hypothetical protein